MRSNATHKTRETNLEMARSKIRPSYHIHIQRTSLEKGHYSPFGLDMFLCLLLDYFRTKGVFFKRSFLTAADFGLLLELSKLAGQD